MVKLFKNYEEDFEKLREECTVIEGSIDVVNTAVMNNANELSLVRKDIRELSKSVEDLSCCIDDLQNAFKDLVELSKKAEEPENTKPDVNENISEDVEADVVEEIEPEIITYAGLSIAKSHQRKFRWTEIDDKTFKFTYYSERNKQDYFSAYTIFDVLIIAYIENEKSWKSWKDLSKMTGINTATIKEIAYNYKRGFFDGFFGDKPIAFSKSYGLLYVNGKKSIVPIRTAKYIVECITNSSKPMTTLLKLEKTKECSKLMTRIIGTSYKNSSLNSLFNASYTDVENNPQKRKEKGL